MVGKIISLAFSALLHWLQLRARISGYYDSRHIRKSSMCPELLGLNSKTSASITGLITQLQHTKHNYNYVIVIVIDPQLQF